MDVKIITLPIDRWRDYKSLRLQSLQTDPQAYLSTIEDELLKPDEKWQERLVVDPSGRSINLFAEAEGKIVGMLGSYKGAMGKTRHCAYIVSFYVAPDFRGKRIGKMLFEGIIKWLERDKTVDRYELSVILGQDAALHLYKKYGFKEVGVAHRVIKVNDKYYDELILEKLL